MRYLCRAAAECLFACAVIAMGGCQSCNQHTDIRQGTSGTGSGRVVLGVPGTGLVRPASGALVRARRTTLSTRTDQEGRFQLPLRAGHAELVITHTEHGVRFSATVSAPAASTTPGTTTSLGDIRLETNGAVRGVVTLDDGAPLATTLVVVPGEPFAGPTSDTGGYILDDLPAGTTQFAAARTGYNSAEFMGSVAPGVQTTLRDQRLQRLQGSVIPGGIRARVALDGVADVAGVLMTVEGLDGISASGNTDGEGRVQVDGLTSTLVHVDFSRSGFTTLRIPYLLVPRGNVLDLGEVLLGTGEPIPPLNPGSSSASSSSSSGSPSSASSASSSSAGSSSSATSGTLSSASSGASSGGPSSSSASGGTTSSSGPSSSSSSSLSSSASSSASSSSVSSSSSSSGAPPAHCSNADTDGDETALNCGGSCAPCPPGDACTVDDDCESNHCESLLCVLPTCFDSRSNGDETGMDCGGPSCAACGPGEPCSLDRDCDGIACLGGACAQAQNLVVTVNGPVAVESQPPGISCPPDCSERFQRGTQVSLTASPASTSVSTTWAGDCNGDAGPCLLTMDADHAASFEATGPRPATVVWKFELGSWDNARVPAAIAPGGETFLAVDTRGGYNMGLGQLNTNERDVILHKASPSGALLLQRRLGGVGDQTCQRTLVLPSGDPVVLAMTSAGDVEFGNAGETESCAQDAMLVGRFSSDALVQQWATCIGAGLSAADSVMVGNDILVAANFGGTVDIAGRVLTAVGASDVVLARISGVDGTVLDVSQLGSEGTDSVGGIAARADGKVVLALSGDGNATLGTLTTVPRGDADALLVMLRADLSPLWVRRFGSTGRDNATAVAVTPDHDVVVAGTFVDALQLSPSPGDTIGTVGSGEDMFVIRLDGETGDTQWGRSFGGSGYDRPFGLLVTPDGLITVSGQRSGTGANYGVGPVTVDMQSVFMVTFTGRGTHVWSVSEGPTSGVFAPSFSGLEPGGGNRSLLSGWGTLNFQGEWTGGYSAWLMMLNH